MKKRGYWILLLATLFITPLAHAETEVLRVGVGEFDPPFVMRGANDQIYGFDVAMIRTVCRLMQKACSLYPMPFSALMDAIARNQVDIAAHAITITPTRMKSMLFSKPYLHPEASFLGLATQAASAFNITNLHNQRIGVQAATIFPEIIAGLNLKDITIKTYPYAQNVIDALQKNEVDLVMLDTQTAWFWEAQSSGTLKTLGQPLSYGSGLGIAISLARPDLVPLVNDALAQYLTSTDYQRDVTAYLYHF